MNNIKETAELLEISTTTLASHLGVTERTLFSWESDTPQSVTKLFRITNLLWAIAAIQEIRPHYSGRQIYGVLVNGRVVVDYEQKAHYEYDSSLEWDGTCSLMDFVVHEDNSYIWRAAFEAIEDFEEGNEKLLNIRLPWWKRLAIAIKAARQ